MVSKPQTILVVEDDSDLRNLFQIALSLEGYKVLEAGDGYEALLLLDAYHVDLVVLDLGLPRIHGFTVQEEVAAGAESRRIPIVIVTASPEDLSHVRVECILRKPVRPDKLIETVRACLHAHVHEPR